MIDGKHLGLHANSVLFSLQKFDDGTITVLEFFKLFNIDFVIHSPRQSILPERVSYP